MSTKRPSKAPDPEQRPAGGVRHDEQGNAVWHWASNTGRQAIESTSRLLRKLEVPGLKLLDDSDEPPGPGGPQAGASRARGKEKNFDPYFSHVAASSRAASKSGARTAKAQTTKPSFLRRLLGRR
jgi:hypothetical protein